MRQAVPLAALASDGRPSRIKEGFGFLPQLDALPLAESDSREGSARPGEMIRVIDAPAAQAP